MTPPSARMYQLRVDLELPAALVDDEEQGMSTLVRVLEAVQTMFAEQGFAPGMFRKQSGAPQVHGITLAPVEAYA